MCYNIFQRRNLEEIIIVSESTRRQINIPGELGGFYDTYVSEVHEKFASLSRRDILKQMPEPSIADISDTERLRYVDLCPPRGVNDNGDTVALFLPHAQAWKPSMYARAEFARQAVAKGARMLVFPNNTFGDSYYQLTDVQRERIAEGDLSSLAEKFVKVIEGLDIDSIALTGYSLGGLVGAEVAAVGSDKVKVTVINADETPNIVSNAKELRNDFMASGGWGDQRQALKDSGIAAMEDILNVPRLAADYVRFGAATLMNSDAGALHSGMARPRLNENLARAYSTYPELGVKLGYMVGSLLFKAEAVQEHPRTFVEAYGAYSTSGNHRHATGDNIVAHALMMLDGLSLKYRLDGV